VADRIRNGVVLGDPRVKTVLYESLRFVAVGAVATIVHYSVLILNWRIDSVDEHRIRMQPDFELRQPADYLPLSASPAPGF
jgi:hypothetical protein